MMKLSSQYIENLIREELKQEGIRDILGKVKGFFSKEGEEKIVGIHPEYGFPAYVGKRGIVRPVVIHKNGNPKGGPMAFCFSSGLSKWIPFGGVIWIPHSKAEWLVKWPPKNCNNYPHGVSKDPGIPAQAELDKLFPREKIKEVGIYGQDAHQINDIVKKYDCVRKDWAKAHLDCALEGENDWDDEKHQVFSKFGL